MTKTQNDQQNSSALQCCSMLIFSRRGTKSSKKGAWILSNFLQGQASCSFQLDLQKDSGLAAWPFCSKDEYGKSKTNLSFYVPHRTWWGSDHPHQRSRDLFVHGVGHFLSSPNVGAPSSETEQQINKIFKIWWHKDFALPQSGNEKPQKGNLNRHFQAKLATQSPNTLTTPTS